MNEKRLFTVTSRENMEIFPRFTEILIQCIKKTQAPDGHQKGTLAQLLTSQTLEYQHNTCAHNFGSNVLIKMHRLENVMRNKLSVLRKTSKSSKGSFGHMHECKNRYIEMLRHLKRAVDRIGEILLDIDV
ncbi:unnamed protein product [Calicophoron daubneyi]|uniref:Uncharacterized protein n=1 Tax=Calicophoron daubneyi TaxID=300641 RepID=A0AAV2TWQ9_CALDB